MYAILLLTSPPGLMSASGMLYLDAGENGRGYDSEPDQDQIDTAVAGFGHRPVVAMVVPFYSAPVADETTNAAP